MAVTFAEVEPKLLTIDGVRSLLAATEPISEVSFPLGGKGAPKWSLAPAFNAGIRDLPGDSPVEAKVAIRGAEYVLTKEALLAATSSIGLSRAYVSRSPSFLIEPHLNYWYSAAPDKDMKLLHQEGVVHAVTRSTVTPFSNLRLLEEAVSGISAWHGSTAQVFADWKIQHDFYRTAVRLVIPAQERTPRDGDTWCFGVDMRNSLAGMYRVPTSFRGYLFRYVCANGAISTHSTSGHWSRRSSGTGDDVYEWARQQVEEVLGGLEHEFEAVEELAQQEQEPSIVSTLEDIFSHYRVPAGTRDRIVELLLESGDLTSYGVMAAVTQAANADGIEDEVREALMLVGGDIPRAATHRCASCHRILDE